VRVTSVTVVVNPLPTVNVSSNPGLTICNGNSTTLTASGATSYAWSNGATTTSISVTTAGVYTVTGTDVNGCTNTASRTVVVNPQPTLSIAPNPSLSVCSGQSTTLTASGAVSYVWSTGATTASITVNTANTYTVTGTDANGCTNTVSAVVVINALPSVGISAAPSLTICSGQTTTLSGTGATSYVWSTGANTSSIVVNTAGVYTVTGTDANGCTNTARVTVVVNALPTISITSNPGLTICSGTTTVLTAAGGSTYLWSTGANTTSINVSVAGTYTVTGTDVNGCTGTASVLVVVNPLPTILVNAAPSLSICSGASTTLTASGGNTYLWSNGQGTASITVSSAGTYSVTGTGANGCTNSASVVVVVNPLPNVVISSNPGLTICNGNTTTLTGTGANSYVWSTGATSTSISASTAGIYTVTGTYINGCTNTASVTVVVRALPTITINPNPSLTICNGTSTTLTASGGTNYIWSTGAITSAITVNTAGTYTVTGTDANGCSNTAAVTVVVTSIPSVNIFSNPGLTICSGRSTSLSASGAVNYLWNTGETTSSITVSTAGIYTVTGTNGGGCTNSATVTVVVNPLPTVFITSNPGLAICNGSATTLTGNGGLTYAWNTGENTASISVSSAGVYTVTGTDVNGCTNTASVTVTVRSLPSVTISPNPSLTICNGNSTTLSASGATNYLWSNGATTTSITVNIAGTYSVTGTDNFGCTNTATVSVTVNPLPNITINSNPGLSVCSGRSTILSAVGGVSYVWSTGETTNSITVSSGGVYTVTGTNNNGCTNSATVTVVIYSLPTVSITSNPGLTICSGRNTTLTGLGATTYQWSNGSNSTSINVSTAGVYTVTGTDANGCSNTASVTVVVNPLPNVIIGSNPGLTICQGQNTTLTVSGANAYSWSTGETTSTITVSSAGTYSVTGTDNNGCSNTATVTVLVNALPNVTINSNPGLTICRGSTTTLAASGAVSYSWSTGETTSSIVVANAGSYSVTGTNVNGCTNSSTVTVTVNNLPTLTVTASPAFSICQGETTTLTVSGAATYVWSNGDVGSTITVNTGGVYTVTGTDANGCTNTSSRTVTVHPLPTVTISSNPGLTLCQGQSTILTANGAFSYVWSTGAQSTNINVTTSGVYSVTGTSVNGCTSSASVTVVVNPNPTVSILSNPGLTICNGQTTTLTAISANSYVWNTGAVTASITVSTAGIYSVTGTDNNGCTGSASVIVVVNSIPSVSISSNPGLTICQGQNTTLTAGGANTYLWNTGANTAAITVTTSGTYTVTGTSISGCTNTALVVVVVNSLPPVTISANPGLTICQGQSTTLTASGASTYIWITGDVGSAISVTAGGLYTVTGTDANGCTNTFSRTVVVNALPTVTIASNPGLTVCQGQNTTLSASGASTYVWSNGAQTSNITVNTSGIYSVTGTMNGCTSSASVTVVVNPNPTISITSNPGLTVCQGQNTTLTALGANSYVWNTGATDAFITVNTAGTYSVTGTDNNGCTGSATVIIVVNANPTVSISSNPGLTLCQGQTTTLTAGGATSYAWNTGANTASIVVNSSGTYTVTGTGLNGCTSTAMVIVTVNPLPAVTISSNPGLTICQGLSTTLTANGALSYVWSNGDVGASINVTTGGLYSVTGTDGNGCVNVTSRTVVVNPLPTVTISATPGLTICQGQSTSLNTSGASSYVWNTGDQTSTINVNLAGVYTVTGTSANGCTSSATVTVVVNPNPAVSILSNPGLTICNGQSTTLTAISATSYVWNTGATSSSISVSTAGIYSVTGTDNNGCTGSATVVVNGLPTVSIFSNPGLNICRGQSTTLIANGANSYIWNTGEITSQITVNLSGTYSVTGTAVNGCTSSALVTVVVNPNPAVNILSNPGLTICQGNNTTLTANGAVSYVWSTGDVAAAINVTIAGTYIVTGTDANGCTGTASRTVVVNPSPTVSITSNPGLTICQGESTTLTALGANSYIWSNGLQSTSISVNSGGTYVVTGTASNGCTGTFSVIVTVNPAPNVTIASNPGLTICNGQNTLLTALGANSYIWNNGFTSSSLTINTAGTYSVTGTGANGCTNSASVTVIVNTPPPVDILSNPGLTICQGGSTTLSAVGANSYVWSNGSVTSSINVNTPGTYTVTGTDVNGCTNTASRTVVINPNPAVSILASPSLTFCQGGNATLTASGALNYVWNTGEVGATITVNTAGVYTVTGTDINGCTTIASRTVVVNGPPALTINSNPGLTICNGSSTLLNALGANSYVWSNGGSGSSITVNAGGVYTVTGTDINGCTNTASVLVVVNNQPNISIAANPGLTVCSGLSTTLTALSGNTYLWSTGANTASISVNVGGIYTVTGTDLNGCTNTASVTVVISSLPNTIISANPGLNICTGRTTQLTASGGVTYLWSTGSTTPSITTGIAGFYSVTATAANGCTGSTGVTVTVNPLPVVSISANPGLSICSGGGSTVLTASGALTYAWNNGALTSSITVNTAGSYTVTGTDVNGCTAQSTVVITQVTLSGNVTRTNVTGCFGNTNGTITISGVTGGSGTYEYSIDGGNNWQLSGLFTNLSAGTYTVQVRDFNLPSCVRVLNGNLTLTQPTQLTAQVTGTNVSCNGGNNGSITFSSPLGGTPPYTYSIGGLFQGSQTFPNLTAGTYNAQMRDANGCTVTINGAFIITEPTVLSATVAITDVTTCNGGNNGTITISNPMGGR